MLSIYGYGYWLQLFHFHSSTCLRTLEEFRIPDSTVATQCEDFQQGVITNGYGQYNL